MLHLQCFTLFGCAFSNWRVAAQSWCVVQVDGLIINCTAFNPTPSLSAAVVRHFRFKSSIRTVNLSGMGCAASVISVDIARDMLKVDLQTPPSGGPTGTTQSL